MNSKQYQCPFLSNYYYGYRSDENMQTQYSGAVANITGGPLAPNIRGTVTFTDVEGGTEVSVEVEGLPAYKPAAGGNPPVGPHGFHIHENGSCSVGNPSDPFMPAGEHWNPTNQPHGNHAGDFPVLFSNNGLARMTFFTNKFTAAQAIGKAIIIHESPDDNKSQPAGAAGRRLACGVIQGML
jgi:superoxide dismutase, Cu-Zn family